MEALGAAVRRAVHTVHKPGLQPAPRGWWGLGVREASTGRRGGNRRSSGSGERRSRLPRGPTVFDINGKYRQFPQRKDNLYMVPLGGCGQIGMNAYLYQHQGRYLLVDLGVIFGVNSAGIADGAVLGAHVFYPDTAFLSERKHMLDGILITHAHEDHIGGISELWKSLRVPVYGTRFAMSMLQGKLERYGGHELNIPLNVVPIEERTKIGCFDIEMIPMAHSIPEACGVMIRTPVGNVFHTGDWKLDDNPLVGPPTDYDCLKRLGEEGVDVVVGDSTNSNKEGFAGSESLVAEGLTRVIGREEYKDSPLFATCFSSNIARIRTLAMAAKANGRVVSCMGLALLSMLDVARATGYEDGLDKLRGNDNLMELSPGKRFYICTGNQGEEFSALHRLSRGQYPSVGIAPGDHVLFASSVIPGNETALLTMKNNLQRQGALLIDSKSEPNERLHVSGHPCTGDLKKAYELLKPKAIVAVHGEYHHQQAHVWLAETIGAQGHAQDNGEVVQLCPGPVVAVFKLPVGVKALDGKILCNVDNPIMQQRQSLAMNGSIAVVVVVDRNLKLLAPARMSITGLLDPLSIEGGDALQQQTTEMEAEKLYGKRPIVTVEVVQVENETLQHQAAGGPQKEDRGTERRSST